jgi:aminoglycoside phosphotransferase (APT) family kinase protein
MKQTQLQSQLADLLMRLSQGDVEADCSWRDWRIRRIEGGQNNLLYHADGPAGAFAVKFTIRDERDRAGREYAALRALRAAGLMIAPEPVLLDRASYPQPVVVQTWLAGEVDAKPPADDDEWLALLSHFVRIHELTRASVNVRLRRAVLNLRSAAEGRRALRQQLAALPLHAQPLEMREMISRVEALNLPVWATPAEALCRVDPNIRNFIRRHSGWASVDWENSGWGDPAFEIADLITHPAYANVPTARWEWVIATYCGLRRDAGAETRIRTCELLMLAWWSARLARMLFDLDHGRDQRLAAWPDDWRASTQARYERYLELATRAIERSRG